MKKYLAFSLMFCAFNVNAQLLNISANGLISGTENASACTIVSSDGKLSKSGYKLLIIMAEANVSGKNPIIALGDVETETPIVANDNWKDESYDYQSKDFFAFGDENIFKLLIGRTPKSITDAATGLMAVPGRSYCLVAQDNSGAKSLYPVSLSITDVTETYIRYVGNP